ncbi:hypothetical protein AB833_02620 [Chromatiales bacterium (ex Bugula neritina AB1)]|nr:hypothetical protein AB833_02620 [Chromatiales bacterium (ex Bugula neritina AB1)]
MSDTVNLIEAINDLGPWHHKVEVRPGIYTVPGESDKNKHGTAPVVFIDDREEFKKLIESIYPRGIEGKSLLDSACNCGAYSMFFQQFGGEKSLGFDAREHWIAQANFLRENLVLNRNSAKFVVSDLYDVKNMGLSPFSVSLFKGIFYHLPDPIGGLKVVADLTDELMIFNSASRRSSVPGLVIASENTKNVMSGMHGLNWFPSDPDVVVEILRTMGFVDFRVLFWHKRPGFKVGTKRGFIRYVKNIIKGNGRFALLASKRRGLFDDFDRNTVKANYGH